MPFSLCFPIVIEMEKLYLKHNINQVEAWQLMLPRKNLVAF